MIGPEGAKSCSQGRKSLDSGAKFIQSAGRGDIQAVMHCEFDVAPPGSSLSSRSITGGSYDPGVCDFAPQGLMKLAELVAGPYATRWHLHAPAK